MMWSEALRRMANKGLLSKKAALFLWEIGMIDSAEKILLYGLIVLAERKAAVDRREKSHATQQTKAPLIDVPL